MNSNEDADAIGGREEEDKAEDAPRGVEDGPANRTTQIHKQPQKQQHQYASIPTKQQSNKRNILLLNTHTTTPTLKTTPQSNHDLPDRKQLRDMKALFFEFLNAGPFRMGTTSGSFDELLINTPVLQTKITFISNK